MSVVLNVGIIILLHRSAFTDEDICSEIKCSNIVDYVCGVSERGNIKIIRTFQNICHLNRIKCKLGKIAHVRQIDDIYCNIKRNPAYTWDGRRVNDFSIVGAHQACNHSCPTYCVDTYEPVCANIWTSPKSYKNRVMINHCHIDLLSCAAGVNVTIEPFGKCFSNPSGLMFMTQIAAMKSLKLIEDKDSRFRSSVSRRSNQGYLSLAETIDKVVKYQRP